MKKLIPFLLFAISAFPVKSQTIEDYRRLFEYDKGLGLFPQIATTRDSVQGTIQDIVFTSINGVKVSGSIIIPFHKIKEFPVVIFLPDMIQNKDIYLHQALDLANEAIASLVLDAPKDRPDDHKFNFRNFTDPRKDFSGYRQSAFDIIRAIDMLEEHERIDQKRIAFVGCGTGAMAGAIVSGIENRISSYLLMGNYFCFSTELRQSTEPAMVKSRDLLDQDQIVHYETVLKPIDPLNYLPHHRNSYIFFQFAQDDPYFDAASAQEAFRMTKDPKRQKLYKTNFPNLPSFQEAIQDRKNWLKDHL